MGDLEEAADGRLSALSAVRPIRFLGDTEAPTRVLAIGAHPDDIEIGCGGTILRLIADCPGVEVSWVVLTGSPERSLEAHASAAAFLSGSAKPSVIVRDFRDGFLPYSGAAVKEFFEELKGQVAPAVIFTHFREDRHQDHRLVSDLTWNTWRDHLIFEYEIPKYDGDFGSPNVFGTLPPATIERKIDLLMQCFPSQATKPWFTSDVFRSVARLRGVEAATGFAEGFYARKLAF